MSDPSATTPTSLRRELAGIEHRRRILERALADEPVGSRAVQNRSELAHLDEQHAAWSEERAKNRELWIQHHTRQRRLHQQLAARHIAELMRLQRMEVVAGAQPSSNGSH